MSKISQLIAQWENVSGSEPHGTVGQALPSVRTEPKMRRPAEPSAPPWTPPPPSPQEVAKKKAKASSSAPPASVQAVFSTNKKKRTDMTPLMPSPIPTPKVTATEKQPQSERPFTTPKQYVTKPYESYLSGDIQQARKTLTAGGETKGTTTGTLIKSKSATSVSPVRKRLVKSESHQVSSRLTGGDVNRSTFSSKPFEPSAIPFVADSFDVPPIVDSYFGVDENASIASNRHVIPTAKRKAKLETAPIVEEEEYVSKDNDEEKSKNDKLGDAGGTKEKQKRKSPLDEDTLAVDENGGRYNLVAPRSKRKCRDILCFLALLVTWAGMVTIGILAINLGNVDALVHATDFKGRICGSCNYNENDAATCGKPFQVIDPNRVDEVFAVCRESCPAANETICPSQIDRNVQGQCWNSFVPQRPLFFRCVPLAQEIRVCTRSPFLEFVNASIPDSADDPMCATCLDPLFEADGIRPKDPSASDCRAKRVEFATQRQFERLHPAMQLFSSWGEIVVHWLADLQASWQAIAVGGGCAALVGSVLWILLFACFSGAVVWLTLFAVVLGSGFVAFELLYAGGVVSKKQVMDALANVQFIQDPDAMASVQIFTVSDSAQTESYAIAGWVLTIVTLILLVLACSLQRNVVRAAAVMRGASRALLFNCSLWVIPVLSFGFVLAVFGWWVFALALLGSAGRVAPASFVLSLTGANLIGNGSSGRPDDWVDVNPAMIVFHTFGCLWTVFFVRAVCAMAISAVVASWRYKERRRLGVCGALGMVIRFHLGTAAFGSAIVAMLQLLRLILSYIDRKTRQATVGKQNALSRAFLAVAKCILGCFSAFLKFATRFSYVIVAIRGESFCLATKSAFVLLSSNLVDSGVSLFLSWAVLLLGRLLVVGLSATCTWVLIWQNIIIVDNLSSYLMPVASSTVLAWFITGACFDLYAASLDTLIICKLEQRARNIKRNELTHTGDEVSMV